MTKAGALDEKKQFLDNNIEADLAAQRTTKLTNVLLLRVSSKDVFPTDFDWYEETHEEFTDAKPLGTKHFYSVLAPISARGYFEGIKKNPTDRRPHQVTFDITIEEVQKDLILTHTEARWFLKDPVDGETDVLKSIHRPRFKTDPITGAITPIRNGVYDVVAEASGAAGYATIDNIGEIVIQSGMYAGKKMVEIPDDYILKGSVKGGLGSENTYIENLCQLEKQRRFGVNKAGVIEAPVEKCSATKADGTPCKQIHGLEVAEDGKLYCKAHMPVPQEVEV